MNDTAEHAPLRATSIAATLEAEIITGQITGGTKLEEQSIGDRFGVSRTPVREALHLLAARALVERIPYRGVIVAQLDRGRIEQLFEAMAETEAMCGRYAAERMSIGERGALQSLHEKMRSLASNGEFAAYKEANTEFHRLIYAGSHNVDIIAMAEAMWQKLAPFRRSQLGHAERVSQSCQEHEAIVRAIVDRDRGSADLALRRHLLGAAQECLAKMR
ncbi:GntR family transcriptional regulator [Donghicola sp. XS_ASV15]|uniref:GntR family transcriptional regulator n=1 Tax=Donghicola sp. XS_ASV15 TaxID=3241295 RepID=UPI003518D0A0